MFPTNPKAILTGAPAAARATRLDQPIDVAAVFRRDNVVIPVSFWTPDDEQIQIDRVMEKLNAAAFKEKGVGDRYKILARGVVTYLFRVGDLWYDGHLSDDMRIPGIHTRHTGAYHGDKTIIDKRYDNPYKVLVRVAAVCYAIGDVVPYAFRWDNNKCYEIDDVMGWERAASVRAGIIGMRYAIRVRDRETYLYRDDDLWFMERRSGGRARVLDVHGRPIL